MWTIASRDAADARPVSRDPAFFDASPPARGDLVDFSVTEADASSDTGILAHDESILDEMIDELRSDLPIDVEPRGGRLLLFLSGCMMHQVLPTHAARLALTAWYH